MKFNCRVDIDLPREKVVALFQDNEKRKIWDKSFISIESVTGPPGENGSTSLIMFKAGIKAQELRETIIENGLPDFFSAKYEHKHMDNTMVNHFRSLSDHQTRYEAEVEYLEFRGFMAKMLAFMFSGVFTRQVQRHLQAFKEYAEKE